MNSSYFRSRTAVPRLRAATSRGIATTSLVLLTTAASLSAAAAPAEDAGAQSPDKASPPTATGGAKDSSLELDTIVVTAVPMATSKLKSSISVSSLTSDQIASNQPQNASDVLSDIPGLFVQSSGGGGNANVSVRGLPISAGGSRYVQFQEDGLPVLLFGDIAFGNPDDFVRMDTSVDRVEVVRGGTGSTLTTNGPGGIINFITKTGATEGGGVGVTTGLGFQDRRFDFNYGGHLTEHTRFFIGGFYESGDGPRRDNAAPIEGGQIKGNITREFDNGYVRLNFKYLSDHQPMYMPAPVNISNGAIHTIPGIDPRNYSGYSPNMPIDTVLNTNNTLSTVNLNDGTVTNSAAVGLESHLDLGRGWTFDDKFRTASNSGNWAGYDPGSGVAGAPADATYANGAGAGRSYAGLALTNVVFDVNVKNLGTTSNDLKLAETLDNIGGGHLTYGAGLFTNTQHVDLIWNFNAYLTTATAQPSPLNSATAGASGNGYLGPGYGACCSRDYEGSYLTTAPYVFASYDMGPLTLDGSFREDYQDASGYYNVATVPTGSPASTLPTYSAANAVPIDYRLNRPEYSFGANYLITQDIALFARYSQGTVFNADRIMDNGPLSGSTPIPINKVDQLEGGVKFRYDGFSAFITAFDARTDEFNYAQLYLSLQQSKYEGKGVEVESGYHIGGFHINVGATYTDATVTASTDAALVGQPENRQPKFIYQFGPGFSTDRLDVGINVQGVSSATETDNTAPNNKLPAYTIVTGHFDYFITPRTVVALGVYNLFNALAYTELDGTTSARALNGRNAKLSLKYSF